MSKAKVLIGILIIAAFITAGCTGNKTMVGNEQSLPASQAAALKDYTKSARELTDEISFINNHYPLSPNATVDEYRAWLDGFAQKLALCRMMYNNTTVAAQKYMGYLNNTSGEYRNVTVADAGYASDIEALNQTYWNHSEYLNRSVKKMAALENYKAKLNSTMEAYGALSEIAQGTKIDSIDSYSGFIDRFKGKATAYETCAEKAIEAGEEYASYCEPGSTEYNALRDNNDALKEGVKKCWETYNNYKKDYETRSGAKVAAQSTFQDYVDKIGKVAAIKKDVDTYRTTEIGPSKLDKSWLENYKQKVDAFNSACNDAIASGGVCKKYLDASSADYATVDKNEKDMKAAMTEYGDNYNSLYGRYRMMHPMGSLLQ